MASRDEMLNELTQLQQEFSRLVRNIDQEDLAFATTSARSIMNRIATILRSTQADFAEDFKANRLRTSQDDLEMIEKFEKTPPQRQDLTDFARLAAHFSRDVRAVERLVKLVYPRAPFSFKPLIQKYGRPVAIAGGSVLIVFLLVTGYSRYKASRQGLFGRYHAGITLEKQERERIDSVIDFRWGRRQPIRGWRGDAFSVRWSGYVHVPFAETWEFITFSDDGVRLFIGDKKVIDNWTLHGTARDSVELKLQAGYYPITLEYFDNSGDAAMRLFWNHQGGRKAEVIPAGNLAPSARYLKGGLQVFETIAPEQILGGNALPKPVQIPAEAPKPAEKSAEKPAAKKK